MSTAQIVSSPALASALLEAELRNLQSGDDSRRSRGQVHRLSVEIADLDPLEWIAAQPDDCKFYWRSRDGSRETAAVGVADALAIEGPLDHARLDDYFTRRLAAAPSETRCYGGLRFDSGREKPAPPWDLFGTARFILPRFELVRSRERVVLACHVLGTELSRLDPSRLFSRLHSPAQMSSDSSMQVFSRQDRPAREDWREGLRRALHAVQSGEVNKVVLARRTSLDNHYPLDPWRVLAGLRHQSRNCTLFCIQPIAGTALLGATPERLYVREGRRVETEALAGTRPRGEDDVRDAIIGQRLLASDKDGREHAWVVRGIRESLEPLCEELLVEPHPDLLKLARVQHLVTRFHGRLREGVTDGRLLAALHPTPAVAGYPRRAAVETVARLEPFDRGWYAGPIGWVGPDRAEFAVALRCGLVHERTLNLFSGAGLVEGSDADTEWEELENKMSTFLASVGPE